MSETLNEICRCEYCHPTRLQVARAKLKRYCMDEPGECTCFHRLALRNFSRYELEAIIRYLMGRSS